MLINKITTIELQFDNQIECGKYIEDLRNKNYKVTYGHKDNIWFLIYDK